MLATNTIDSASLAETPTPEAQREEAEAVRRAFEGRWLPRARLALRSLHRLLQDPNDTRQVFILSIAVSAGHLPRLLADFLSNEDGLALLTERAAIDSTHVDFDALRALPADTLGGAYVRFLDDNGLDPDLFQAPPGMPPGIAYVIQRMRQTHDLWHVVTGYESDIPGEISILAFTYGQTGAPSMRLLATVGTLRYSFEFESIFRRVWRAYQRGKAAPFLGTTRWEKMWHLPLTEVRERLQVH
jgi:ubiquinone biosynthesis protein COQ4